MTKRSSVAPPAGASGAGGTHAMRRSGARREVTERVGLRGEDGSLLEGWALNVSRGGLRVIVEEKVVLGQKFDVTIGAAEDATARPARIVWVQEEPDGTIVGIEFLSLSGTHQTVPPAEPTGDLAPPDGTDTDR